jgi:hypothetical protein
VPIPAEYAEGIRGVLWDAGSDAPAAGVLVRLESAGRTLAETRTDASGIFSFETAGDLHIAPGAYELIVEAAGRRVRRPVAVVASETVTLVGRLEI